MKAIIRTHVKHPGRLAILEATIVSARAAGIEGITVVDDQSPLMVEVRVLCYKHGCAYLLTTGTPGTKNGLYWSLQIDSGDDLHLCDDVALAVTNWYDLPPPCNWGLISYFAAYARQPENGWWRYPTENFYAALACRFHPTIRKLYIEQREAARDGLIPETGAQDDILVKEILQASGMEIWNTGWDFAQHTGVEDSTFTGPHDCAYRSNYFIGERGQ